MLRVRFVIVGVFIAVELALGGLIADLVAGVCVRNLEAGVESLVEAEVAAVAVFVVGAFEALHAAEDLELLPLGHTDSN